MNAHHNAGERHGEHGKDERPYRRLAAMALLSFVSMYGLMYAMVDVFANVYPNANQFYMAGLMTSPMVLIELWLMRSMYPNSKVNRVIAAASVAAALIFFAGIRLQAGVSDKQFLMSMIPHHASALLMCNQAPLQDPEIQRLCASILSSQQAEIDQMKAKLTELNK